ncbi:MAG: hypothetical protein WBK54_04420 [Bacilli bacterium]|jgi:hypothetical protein
MGGKIIKRIVSIFLFTTIGLLCLIGTEKLATSIVKGRAMQVKQQPFFPNMLMVWMKIHSNAMTIALKGLF